MPASSVMFEGKEYPRPDGTFKKLYLSEVMARLGGTDYITKKEREWELTITINRFGPHAPEGLEVLAHFGSFAETGDSRLGKTFITLYDYQVNHALRALGLPECE